MTILRTTALICFTSPAIIGLASIPAFCQPAGDFNKVSVYRQVPGQVSSWFVDSNGSLNFDSQDGVYPYGLQGDVPIMGDWWGTSHLQMGVYRGGLWMMDWNDNHHWDTGDQQFSWGLPGDIPVVGDWTHTGKLQIGVVRNVSGSFVWYVNTSPECGSSNPLGCDYTYTSNNHPGSIQSFQWGLAGDLPVVGNWNGQQILGMGSYRPSEGNWYLNTSTSVCSPASIQPCDNFTNNYPTNFLTTPYNPFGIGVGTPIMGCWLGSCGVTTQNPGLSMGFFSNGTWLNPQQFNGFSFGQAGDVPMTGPWVVQGAAARGGANYRWFTNQIDQYGLYTDPIANYNNQTPEPTYPQECGGFGPGGSVLTLAEQQNPSLSPTWGDCVQYQLQQMYGNGLRKLRLWVNFGENTGTVCSPTEFIGGIIQTDSNGLPQACLNNLLTVLTLAKQLGFNTFEIVVQPALANDPDVAQYNPSTTAESWKVITQVRNVAMQAHVVFYIDMYNEGSYSHGSPELFDYMKTMWSNYVALGADVADTVGFSIGCGVDCDTVVPYALSVYSSSGIYPPVYDLHIYDPPIGTASVATTYSYADTAMVNAGQSSKPWIIGEASYNDPSEASELQSLDFTKGHILFLLEWPQDNTGPVVDPPFIFTNYALNGW
jgi:hypothetical protein